LAGFAVIEAEALYSSWPCCPATLCCPMYRVKPLHAYKLLVVVITYMVSSECVTRPTLAG
jgi:hypothetical protein